MSKRSGIRDALAAQVERCMYVERVDALEIDDARTTCDSFRKSKWLRQKALRAHSASADEQQLRREHETHAAGAREALRIQQQLAQELERAAAAMARRQKRKSMRALEAAARASARDHRRDLSVPLAFEAFVDEIQLSDVDVSCSLSPLQATPFDPIGAISVPSTREGNSLTLCCWEQALDPAATQQAEGRDDDSGARNEQLVVFGGRVLQDISMLLPAAVQRDPMQFERVRYTHSNAVYAYDIATGVWQFRECTGRVPRARSDHTAVFVEPHSLIVIGGRGRNGQLFNDVVVLDLVTWHWTHVDTDAAMLERYWHACCVTDESVFVFGGKSEVLVHGDVQQLKRSALCDVLAKASSDTKENQLSSLAAAPTSTTQAPGAALPPLSWICPHTVGKAPSPRFGMALVALGSERIAVVGGCRLQVKKRAHHALQRPPRLMDVHILDTVTMIWSTPRLSSHASALAAPTERMLFECFYRHATLIVFGGFTYATNGETESYTPRQDDAHVVYKLDVNRMIWRRQELADVTASSVWLPSAHVHASANAVLRDDAFTCCASNEHTQLALAALRIRPTVVAIAASIASAGDRAARPAPRDHADDDDNSNSAARMQAV